MSDDIVGKLAKGSLFSRLFGSREARNRRASAALGKVPTRSSVARCWAVLISGCGARCRIGLSPGRMVTP